MNPRFSELDTEEDWVRALLTAASAEAVPLAARERVARRLGIPSAPFEAPAPRAPEPAVRQPALGKQSRVWMKVGWFGVVGALSVGGSASQLPAGAPALESAPAALARALPEAPPPPRSEAAPSMRAVEMERVPNGDAAPAPAPSANQPSTSRGRSPSARPRPAAARNAPAPASGLLEEVRRLDAVRRELRRGQNPGALSLLADYARAFPRGELALEASVLQVTALFAAARDAEARALARRTLATPGSDRYRAELVRLMERR